MKEDKPLKPKINEEDNTPTFTSAESELESLLDATSSSTSDEEEAVDESTDTPVDEAVDPNLRVAELEEQVSDLQDKLLRALAETENIRRRAQRDKEDTSKYAIKNFAEDMLGIFDNLARALSSIAPDARSNDENLENIAVGVEMVMKELLTTFERSGIILIDALGASFDPMLHEALFEIEDPGKPIGTIAQVMEDGFTLHGRTLRAAKVGITKGGPKVTQDDRHEEEAATKRDGSRRDGQQAYEAQAETAADAGTKLDQKL